MEPKERMKPARRTPGFKGRPPSQHMGRSNISALPHLGHFQSCLAEEARYHESFRNTREAVGTSTTDVAVRPHRGCLEYPNGLNWSTSWLGP
ncbi:hypothetical protein MRX96_001357 [Rhipicephalus microplus]